MMKKRLTKDELADIASLVLIRMDTKGESIAEAVEAVTGSGDKKLVKKVHIELGGNAKDL